MRRVRNRGPALPSLAGACLAALALAPLGGETASAQKVGTAAAVNPDSTGRPPGGTVRTLTLGAEVVHNERIRTDGRGSVQLLFVDRTSMSIGPNSDVTIDEYVFDPNANTGKLAVTVGKGLMRFVGGQVSHTGEATVTTPSASIGIRGGTGIIDVQGQNTRTINLFGRQTVSPTGGGSPLSLYRPNFMLDVNGITPPSAPIVATAELIERYIAAFEAKPGQTGGSRGHVNQQTVQTFADAHNVTGTISTGSSPVQSITTYVRTAFNNPSWPTYFQTSNIFQTTQTAVQQGQQSAAVNSLITQPPTSAQPFVLSMTNCCSPNNPTSIAPYMQSSLAFGGKSLISPVLGVTNAPSASQGSAITSQFLQFGVGLSGDQGTQQTWLFVAAGTVYAQGNGAQPQAIGEFFGTARTNSTQPMSFAFGALGSTDVTVNSGGVPTSMTLDGAGLTITGLNHSTAYSISQEAATTSPSAPFSTPAVSSRPNVTLAGYAGGLMQTSTDGALSAPYAITGTTGTPSDVSIGLNPTTSQVSASIAVSGINGGGNHPLQTASYIFDPNAGSSAYVDYNTFGSVNIGGSGTSSTTATTVNGHAVVSSSQALVNIPASYAQALLASNNSLNGAQICQCDYTRWGFWSTDTYRLNPDGSLSQDVGHANLWVAGQLPNISDVPQSGTATYSGNVVAQVYDGSHQYLSGGSFTDTVNFGTKTGSVTADLDGGIYQGNVNFKTDPRNFGGTLPITNYAAAGLSYTLAMQLNGSFFKGVSSPVGEMGGSVYVSGAGTPYIASGIFAAKMQ